MNKTLGDLATRLGGDLKDARPDTTVTAWATDSREAKAGSVFLAIRGSRVDGHDFVPLALASGAAAAVVEKPVNGPRIEVKNLPDALAAMAKSWRNDFAGPVIGITGSAGKTTTKEFVAAALGSSAEVLKSEGNRNTEYTLPLMWSRLEPSTKYAVVELATRGTGQIAHLAAFAQPTIGLITNIGYSHVEMLGDREAIAREKGTLLRSLPADGVAVLWAEDEYRDVLASSFGGKKVTFGFSDTADCSITNYRLDGRSATIASGTCFGRPWSCRIASLGRQNALAAAAAILAASLVGISPAQAAESLASVVLPPLRMEMKSIGGVTVLLDAYNASPSSMEMGLQTLCDLAEPGRRYVALAAMRELGKYEAEAHRSLGIQLASSGISGAVLLGEPMRAAIDEAKGSVPELVAAKDLAEVADFLRKLHPGDTVLVKGSRSYELERAVAMLQ